MRKGIILAIVAIVAFTSCSTVFISSDICYQDGIYYKASNTERKADSVATRTSSASASVQPAVYVGPVFAGGLYFNWRYDPWFYDPWYYDPWYRPYDPWYRPWYRPYPWGPYYPVRPVIIDTRSTWTYRNPVSTGATFSTGYGGGAGTRSVPSIIRTNTGTTRTNSSTASTRDNSTKATTTSVNRNLNQYYNNNNNQTRTYGRDINASSRATGYQYHSTGSSYHSSPSSGGGSFGRSVGPSGYGGGAGRR